MQDVMRCFEEELIEAPADSKAYRILRFMVQKKLADIERGGREPQVYSRSALLLSVEGGAIARNADPARWLKPGLLESYLESRQASLIIRLQRAGLGHMPAIRTDGGKGGKGIERTYWLDTEAIPLAEEVESAASGGRQLTYRRSESGEVKPSLLLRFIFSNGTLKNRSWRGLALFGVTLCGFLLFVVWLFAGMWSVSSIHEALSLRQLLSTAFFAICGWIIWTSFYSPWVRLVDERVVKASAALLSFKEDSAELEMHRDSDKQQWTRIVRFSGDCPICGGRVLLSKGKPDQVLPLVGRCNESPYAHVFSFDRVRLEGSYLGPGELPLE